MVDIVDGAVAVTDIDQRPQYFDDVVVGEYAVARGRLPPHPAVELHPAHCRKVIALRIEEQVLEQVLGGLLGRRFARPHHPVDFHQCLQPRLGSIDAHRIGDERSAIQVVDVKRADLLDSLFDQRSNRHGIQFVVGAGQQFAGLLVDDIVGQDSTVQVFRRNFQMLDSGLCQLADVPHGNPPVLFDHRLVADLDIETGGLPPEPFHNEFQPDSAARQRELVDVEEYLQHLLVAEVQRPQQDGYGQLAASVDAYEYAILGIELEIEPGSTVGNHPRGEQQLAGGMRLALVMVEEHTGRTV